MTRPSLLIISFSDIGTDARVLKQVRAFAETHDVTTCGFGDAPTPGVEHIRVDASKVPEAMGARRIFVAVLDRLSAAFNNFELTYRRSPAVVDATRLLTGRRFDVALANDVDTVAIALQCADGSRVHVDLHEYFPGIHETTTALGRRQRNYLTWLVRRYATKAASSTTVSKNIAVAYRAFGLQCEVATNATPYFPLSPSPVGRTLRLVHSGNAQPSRQLERTMRAVAQTTADVTFDLFLMPNDVVYLERLRRLADELGPRVRVLDPVRQSDLVETLNDYDVGVHVLPPTSFNNANALPNKFFDYVQARLGLLIGPSPEMASVVTRHGLGTVARGFEIADITAALDTLTQSGVEGWKARSHAAAEELSAERQIDVWRAAVGRLSGK